jgi:ElaA protein
MKLITKSFEELTTQELYKILEHRTAVFIVEQTCYYQECDGKDQDCFHQWLENENEELVAYVRICRPGVSYSEPSIGRVLVVEQFRGNGFGREIMKNAMSFSAKQFSVGTIRISAQKYLEEFYNSLGFEPTGKEYLEDGIPHLEMLYKK